MVNNCVTLQGLNCYHGSIVNAAAFVGVDYPSSFAGLWSETDFTYDQMYHIYLTKRLLTNLATLGAELQLLACSSTREAEESLSLFQEGEWIIVGMDAYHLPWTPYYQTFQGPHYFLAQREKGDALFCVDPMYNKEHMQIMSGDLVLHAFDLCRINKMAEKPLPMQVRQEAEAVICTHPKTLEALIAATKECICGQQKNAELLAKYIDGLINNRHLYRYYLQHVQPDWEQSRQFFDHHTFLKWTSVKNGLYKASLINQNESIIHAVCSQLADLFHEEVRMAEKIKSTMHHS